MFKMRNSKTNRSFEIIMQRPIEWHNIDDVNSTLYDSWKRHKRQLHFEELNLFKFNLIEKPKFHHWG